MGILINALVLVLGGFIGSFIGNQARIKNSSILGIAVMLISTVGIFENIFSVSEGMLESSQLLCVTAALIVGWAIGEWLRLDDKLSHLSNTKSAGLNTFIDATVFFGIGGLQICGPILLALEGDSSQLYLKSMIDFPFAVMFGLIYGKSVILSALPVALLQIMIASAAYLSRSQISDSMLSQLCSIGYLILFFGGFNLVCDAKYKIRNINMIPAILIIILYNLAINIWRSI